MSSVNKVSLLGRLGQDPESRSTASGDTVVSLSLATSESWKDKATGERKERTEWHKVVIFNSALAKVAMDYLRKGSLCYIEGSLQTRKWVDKAGQDRYQTEVVLQKFQGELKLIGGRQEGAEDRPKPKVSQQSYSDELDDEVPF